MTRTEPFCIAPLSGVGPIAFGMTRQQLRSIFGTPTSSFARTPESVPCDEYRPQGFFVYYMADDTVEAVEFFAPSTVLLGEHSLLGEAFEKSRLHMLERDQNLSVEADGLTSNAFGIALFAPSANDDPTLCPESILVFRKGYFDQG